MAKCGCQVRHSAGELSDGWILFCKMHAAAPELLKVARDLVFYGPALIAREYEAGSGTVAQLVRWAALAVKLAGETPNQGSVEL